ncbi:helix-turn-helix domain-containing protein [Paenibacillus mucilaginosus]|uniref:Transcriptional regulator, AraC family n=1 Tax=Paenibacillus mucilaginosus (strain KNP414) TaxID=1036673 RepID=F8FK56_PAEMK|nr:helix-turn-helix domain-containing protein [Paenibacillus mucilaginosus]AEI44097.1 transcriptional regulator, AraC family [Paenibacillus mucilaginosus KNP414]MCG7212427.1 helix-turn-helix domain-containing protein [Paenibacillus mucilaginosus]WDM25532.1 helix-turn-helix domain-containing protein [Paenibacillus mucilaginosus]
MKKTWYHRLILSYVPVIFLLITVLIFAALSVISEVSIRETEKANRISARYVMDSLETRLRDIERAVLEEMGGSAALDAFYNPDTPADPLLPYEVSKGLHRLADDHPLIHSIYLYRARDGVVLTLSGLEPAASFGDRAFVEEAAKREGNSPWSGVRGLREWLGEPETEVISLAKRALLPLGGDGIVVVNVKARGLFAIADEMINKDLTYMEIRRGEARLYSSYEGAPGEPSAEPTTRLHSEALGWEVVSGIKPGALLGHLSLLSHLWVWIGGFAIVTSLGYLFYITRSHYKPIENIMKQIQTYHSTAAARQHGSDEFSFIGRVLDTLMNQTAQYEKQYKEDLLVRRRQVFLELLSGRPERSDAQWEELLARLGIGAGARRCTAAVVEIDRYARFREKYSERDRNLLQFAVTNAAQEFAAREGMTVWAEWTDEHRLGVLFLEDGASRESGSPSEVLDRLRTWTPVHLNLSLTAGVGRGREDLTHAGDSYAEALAALRCKMSLGGGRVLRFEDRDGQPAGNIHPYFGRIDSVVRSFRLADEDWDDEVSRLLLALEGDLLRDDGILVLLEYWAGALRRSMEELGGDTLAYWVREAEPELLRAAEELDTLEELLPVWKRTLEELHRQYLAHTDRCGRRGLAGEIRRFIKDDYANADLSLALISDKFGVGAKYASQLFKDEFGMKFVDYLCSLRMEHAKRLLLETDASLPEISQQVGYTHSISFGRTFKKVVGVTPGDYRKYMQPPGPRGMAGESFS